MKILVDINHPGHVHFFKHFIRTARKMGHHVVVVASEKDQTTALLKEYNIPHISIPGYGNKIWQKLWGLIWLNLRILHTVIKHQPDVLLGVASFRCAQVGFLTRKRVVIFDDTEHSKLEIAMYKPFASEIHTPVSFSTALGRKHVRYNSYHELAYLHPNQFTADPQILHELGLLPLDRYFVMRFISWNAGHDFGCQGLDDYSKRRILQLLENYGKVFITSESPLPEEFDAYRISLTPGKIHHLLYYAEMYVGEGGTMATESAILGTPSVLINPLQASNFDELCNHYHLMHQFSNGEDAYVQIESMLQGHNIKDQWRQRREKLLREKIDASCYLVKQILHYSPRVVTH